MQNTRAYSKKQLQDNIDKATISIAARFYNKYIPT
jgi:hypothetical protein